MAKQPTTTRKNTKKMTDATTEATTAPKSTLEKLNAARALVAKYERELAAEAIKNDIQAGDAISFNFGRGDKARVLDGTVVATKMIEEGTLKGLNLLVTSGEGFDQTSYKVHVRDVMSNTTADERRADTPGNDADADPLAAE